MLRNLGIRWQILSALALPVLVLGLISSQVTYQALVDMRDSKQSLALSKGTEGFAKLINAISAERALSVAVAMGQPGAKEKLLVVRKAFDTGYGSNLQTDSSNRVEFSPEVARVFARSAMAHAQLSALRAEVDAGKSTPQQIAAGYTKVIETDVELPADLAGTLSDRTEAANFIGATKLNEATEALAQEQLTGLQVILGRGTTLADQRQFGDAIAAGQRGLADFQRTAPAAQQLALKTALAAPGARSADLAKARTAFQAVGTSGAPAVNLADWTAITVAQINAITAVAVTVGSDGVVVATDLYNSARSRLQLTLGGALGVTLLTLLLALGLSRRISAPLRRLTAAASQIRDELPRLVESVQSDEELQIQLPTVETVGRNEVSQLAAAFMDVNAVTVEIAREQARLRGAVADMFVNVARRNHVLLSRQLAFIDQLERNEVNPDALEELFRLDHLATRMRRNAESLLVLAGIESGRRLREPMPLSDVVRTATSEIEHYSRVSLSLGIDPPIFAHVALPVAHLLAEVLENATNFSDPGSTVVVMASATSQGVRMTVADDGLGMSAEELAEINARIEEPPKAEALSSQRLGFFVVGRLAKRLDAKVTLTAGRTRGTAVLIDLPGSLFTPGALDGASYNQSGGLDQQVQLPALPAQLPAQPSAPSRSEWSDAPSRTPEPVGAALATPAPPAPAMTPISSLPLLPLSFNADALVAEAANEPIWMPQPDAETFGAPSTPNANPIASVPLSRRAAAPVAPPVSDPEPAVRPTLATRRPAPSATAEPGAKEWAASEWAAPVQDANDWAASSSEPAPEWANSDWVEPETRPSRVNASVEALADASIEITSDMQVGRRVEAPVEAAPSVPPTSLFSGFRSRREAAASAAPAAPVPEVVVPEVVAPTARHVVETPAPPAPFLESAQPVGAWFDAPDLSDSSQPQSIELPSAQLPPVEPPSDDPDQWQAWAEVGADGGDTFAPSPGLVAPVVDAPENDQPAQPTPAPAETVDYPPVAVPSEPVVFAARPEVFDAETAPSEPAAYADESYSPELPQLPETWTPDRELYVPEPHAQSSQPEAYAAQPYIAEPEVYVPEPEAYAEEPEAYLAQPEAYTPEPYEASVPEAWVPDLPEPVTEPVAQVWTAAEPEAYPAPAEPEYASEHTEGNSELVVPELGKRTLTAAIDILPQRTTIRTALGRSRRKGDSQEAAGLPFNGGFDPIAPAREFARREGFSESIDEAAVPVGAGEPNGAGTPAVPQTTGPWEPGSPSIPVERRQHPRRSSDPAADERGGRTALASEALSELSRLSSYSPTSMPGLGAGGLQRRPPSEMLTEDSAAIAVPSSQRARTAANVRSMLAGFKAGVERGRTSPSANRPAGDREPGFLPQPRNSPAPGGRDE